MPKITFPLIALSVLLAITLACNIGGSQPAAELQTSPAVEAPPSGLETQPAPSEPTSPPLETQPPTPQPSPTPSPTPVSALPVSIQQGLASLDSYRLSITTELNGPTKDDISSTVVEMEITEGGKTMHTKTTSTNSTAEDPQKNKDVFDQYQVGNFSCSLPEGESEADKETNSPIEQEMRDLAAEIVDVIPLIADPSFVATEDLNGVETNHYTFSVAGLGADSGAEVVQNQGEYWMAVDGQYLVKYSLVLETRTAPESDPNAQAMVTKFIYALTDINQPITITLPPPCQ